MHTLRSYRAAYTAAFILGGLLALLLAVPARAAEPFRLDRLAIVRIAPTDDGRLLLRNGVLFLNGEIAWRGTQTIERSSAVSDWALNRNLVNVHAWAGFRGLGGASTSNFEIQEGGARAVFGDQAYLVVGVSPWAYSASGKFVNISTRARLAGSGHAIIAGFVVEDQPRTLLVRAVGPGLSRFGVGNAHPDPWLTIKRNDGQADIGNDNWSNQGNVALVEAAAARVGAFPLESASLDAAKLVILPPGAYTVHVGSHRGDIRDHDVLVEVYSVPEDIFD